MYSLATSDILHMVSQILVHVVAGVIIVVIFGKLSVSVLLDPLKPVGFLRLLVVLVLAKVYAIVFFDLPFYISFFQWHQKTVACAYPVIRTPYMDRPG